MKIVLESVAVFRADFPEWPKKPKKRPIGWRFCHAASGGRFRVAKSFVPSCNPILLHPVRHSYYARWLGSVSQHQRAGGAGELGDDGGRAGVDAVAAQTAAISPL